MLGTPSLSQALQSCPSTQVLLQNLNLRGMFSPLGSEMVSLMSWGGFLLCQWTLSPPWRQLLMADGSACVILGEERQESQQFRRLAGGVCIWCVLLGSPREKDPCDTGFSARVPSETDCMAQGVDPSSLDTPQTRGVWTMWHSHPISASNTVLSPSPGGTTCDPQASPQHTVLANTPVASKGGKEKPQNGRGFEVVLSSASGPTAEGMPGSLLRGHKQGQ